MAKKKEPTSNEIQILEMNEGRVVFCILGTTGIILNRMSNKGVHELLFPAGRKGAAEKATTLKHDPLAEYRASPYTDRNPNGPTVVQHVSSAFKKALAGVATDIPGAAKAQVGRLTWVVGERVPIYGVPQMLMAITRSADMNKTPDVRTRMIIPNWACQVEVAFASPMFNQSTIGNLMAAAGRFRGVGDWRTEKGSGTFGSFEIVEQNDPRWKSIVKNGGRKAQLAAIESPDFYDDETAEMYGWFVSEVASRGKAQMLSANNGVNHEEAEVVD